jgi:ATP-binding cassette subfamily B protein
MIAVIDNGQIIEQGNHESLVQLGGLYRQLYDKQFIEAEESNPLPGLPPASGGG